MAVDADTGFRHEAFLHAGDDEFVSGTAGFVRDGVASGQPVLVVLPARHRELLRAELGEDADAVLFADLGLVGGNPARIIPAWQEFVDRADHVTPVRGVGEPAFPSRSPAELVECQRHEALLNLAFAGAPAFRLLCPYDTDALPPEVVDGALRTHPVVRSADRERASDRYDAELAVTPFAGELPEPGGSTHELGFDALGLDDVRRFVAGAARDAGLSEATAGDFVLAVHELATNSVRHGGGGGLVRTWREPGVLVGEVRDHGRIVDPLVGRHWPAPQAQGGRGVWLANQLCDLVQVRSSAAGTVVRLQVRTGR